MRRAEVIHSRSPLNDGCWAVGAAGGDSIHWHLLVQVGGDRVSRGCAGGGNGCFRCQLVWNVCGRWWAIVRVDPQNDGGWWGRGGEVKG